MNIKNAVEKALKHSRRTKVELAKLWGVSRTAVYDRIERGDVPYVDMLKMAELCEVTLDQIHEWASE